MPRLLASHYRKRVLSPLSRVSKIGAKGTIIGWVPRKPKTTPLKVENELRTYIHPDYLVKSSLDDRLTLLNVLWQITYS